VSSDYMQNLNAQAPNDDINFG